MVTWIFILPASVLLGFGCQTSLDTCASFSSFIAKPLGDFKPKEANKKYFPPEDTRIL